VALGGFIGMLSYALPILALLLVLPAEKITGISGFMSAVETVFSIYGVVGPILLKVAVLAFIITVAITGSTWALAANRALAVASADGAFFRYFAKFDPQLQTPLRLSVLGGILSIAFMFAGVKFSGGHDAATFAVVLSIAISTSSITYLFVFPSALRLRFSQAHASRPYTVPGGTVGMAIAAGLTTAWVALGTLTAVFPGTAETIFGLDYPFFKHWGVLRPRFEAFALGTLAVVLAIAVIGFCAGRRHVSLMRNG
jgi:glutamate:GABA antiporter